MFNQTLKRPMFRRGGSAEGITSGLRRGYEEGKSVNIGDYISRPPELPKSSSLNDFLINFGLNMVGNAPTGNIFQTAATQAKEPFGQFQQASAQDRAMKYKHAQSERAFQLEIYKAMTDEDKIALQKEIEYLMSEHGISKEEALNLAMPKYRKPRDPGEQKLLDTEYERDQLAKDIATIQSGLSKEGSYVSAEQAKKIYDFYKQADDQGWRYEADAPFIDLSAIQEEWRDAGKKEVDWLSPEGNIAISPDEQATYDPGLYYVDHFTGDVYQVGPGSTELIKIDLSEIKIN